MVGSWEILCDWHDFFFALKYSLTPFYNICSELANKGELKETAEINPSSFTNQQCYNLLSFVTPYIFKYDNALFHDNLPEQYQPVTSPGQSFEELLSEVGLNDFDEIRRLCYNGNDFEYDGYLLSNINSGINLNDCHKLRSILKTLSHFNSKLELVQSKPDHEQKKPVQNPKKLDHKYKNWVMDFSNSAEKNLAHKYEPKNSIHPFIDIVAKKTVLGDLEDGLSNPSLIKFPISKDNHIIFESLKDFVPYDFNLSDMEKYEFNPIIFCISIEKFIDYLVRNVCTMNLPSGSLSVNQIDPLTNDYDKNILNAQFKDNKELPLCILQDLSTIVDSPVLPFKMSFINKVREFTKTDTFQIDQELSIYRRTKLDLNINNLDFKSRSKELNKTVDNLKREFRHRIRSRIASLNINPSEIESLTGIPRSSKFYYPDDTPEPLAKVNQVTYNTLKKLSYALCCSLSYLHLEVPSPFGISKKFEYNAKENFHTYTNNCSDSLALPFKLITKYIMYDQLPLLDQELENISLQYLQFILCRKLELERRNGTLNLNSTYPKIIISNPDKSNK